MDMTLQMLLLLLKGFAAGWADCRHGSVFASHCLEPPEKQKTESRDGFQHSLHGRGRYPCWWALLWPCPQMTVVLLSIRWCFCSQGGIVTWRAYLGSGACWQSSCSKGLRDFLFPDRKAVISQGMLKCLGSSLFLKTKWGIGYRLRYSLCVTSSICVFFVNQ